MRFFLKRYVKRIVILLGCIPLAVAFSSALPLLAKGIIDVAIARRSLQDLIIFVGAIVILTIAGSLVRVFQSFWVTAVSEQMGYDLRNRLFEKLVYAPYFFFQNRDSGEIVNRIIGDVDAVSASSVSLLSECFSSVCTLCFTVAIIMKLSPLLGIVAMLMAPLMLLPLWRLSPALYSLQGKSRLTRDALMSRLDQMLSTQGYLLMKLLGQESSERERLRHLGGDAMKLALKSASRTRSFTMLLSIASLIGPVAIWILGGYLTMEGRLSVGTLVAFMAYMWNLISPASSLIGMQARLATLAASIDRVTEYLALEAELPTKQPTPWTGPGRISFERVSFRYPETADANGAGAVNDVSFALECGEHIAIVGPSGAGKSTLALLLARIFGPTRGRILLDGVDVGTLDPVMLRQVIGIVSQHTLLIQDTVSANIAYGTRGSNAEDVRRAAQTALIHDRIMALPEQYDTVIGSGGYKLSGGERQRIALARMFLRAPKILVLDEATSALDSALDEAIRSEIARLECTTITIAHRLSSVANADRIFTMDGGQLAEQNRTQKTIANSVAALTPTVSSGMVRNVDVEGVVNNSQASGAND